MGGGGGIGQTTQNVPRRPQDSEFSHPMEYEREAEVKRYYEPRQSAGKEKPEGNSRRNDEERADEIFDSVGYEEIEHPAPVTSL